MAQLDRHDILRSVDQLSRTLLANSGVSPGIRTGRHISAKPISPLGNWLGQTRPGRSIGKANRPVSNSVLPEVANAKHDLGGDASQSAVVSAESPCFPKLEHRYVAGSDGCHGKWDKLVGFAVALVMHSSLFLVLWHHEKVRLPSSATTVSIVYLGPSSQEKAGEVGAPKAVRSVPTRQKPTRTDGHVSAKPTVSTAEVAAPAAVVTPAVEAAPARQMAESTEAPGTASSPAASGPTNVRPSPGRAAATQSVLLSSELSVSCSERTPPSYPKLSLRLGEQGRTLLLVELDEQGRVVNVSVKTGSGYSRLDEAAVNAVKSWRCAPALRNGVAVRSVATQQFNFALTGR